MPIHNLFRNHGNVSQFMNPFSGDRQLSGGSASYPFYLPRAISVDQATLVRGATPAGSTVRLEFYNGTEGSRTQTGADTDLTDPAVSARATVTGSWPAATLATAAGGDHVELSTPSGTPGADDMNAAFSYTDDADPTIQYQGFGGRTQNLLSGVAAATNRFTTFGVGPSVNATEANVAVPWPLAGTFKHVALVYSGSTGNGVTTLVLRVNGADSAITFALAETASVMTLVTNTVLTAAVVAGDLVNWRMSRDGAGAGGFTCTLICGFFS